MSHLTEHPLELGRYPMHPLRADTPETQRTQGVYLPLGGANHTAYKFYFHLPFFCHTSLLSRRVRIRRRRFLVLALSHAERFLAKQEIRELLPAALRHSF